MRVTHTRVTRRDDADELPTNIAINIHVCTFVTSVYAEMRYAYTYIICRIVYVYIYAYTKPVRETTTQVAGFKTRTNHILHDLIYTHIQRRANKNAMEDDDAVSRVLKSLGASITQRHHRRQYSRNRRWSVRLVCVCVYIYIHVYMYMYTHTYIYIYMYMYVCILTYTYMYTCVCETYA